MINTFTTHTGEVVEGKRLKAALGKTADEYVDLAKAIREADDYAPHVSEATKDDILEKDLEHAEQVRMGVISSLSVAQRLNANLTGVSVPLLP